MKKELADKDHELNLLRAEVAVARRALVGQKRLKEQLAAHQVAAVRWFFSTIALPRREVPESG